MRVLVFGAGAMGSFIGGMLSQKNEVILIGRREHVEGIRTNGLAITGKTEIVVHPEGKERIDGKESPQLVLVTTKAYDTEKSMMELSPFHDKAIFLSLQNGLDNEEIISRYTSKVVGGVTSHGLTYEGPGRIRHAGIGRTLVGNYEGAGNRVTEIANALSDSGIPTEITDDIRTEIWKKVIVNAGINPLTAITRKRNGALLEDRELERTLETICAEAVQVANAYDIDVTEEEAIAQTKEVVRLTAENMSSMLQDVEHGKRTEIDGICGAIVRRGTEKGIPTPVNSSLVAILKGIEAGKAVEDLMTGFLAE